MRLTRLVVRNFRSIEGSVTIAIPSRHVALVGSNNAGKSNLIAAMDWLLGARLPYQLRPTETDYFDPGKPIFIEATLGDIEDTDKGRLMGLSTSQRQRGALASKEAPEITLKLAIPALFGGGGTEDDEEPDKTELEIDMWGFKVHKKLSDVRRALIQLVQVGPTRNLDDDLQASRWTPYGQLMKAVLEGSSHYPKVKELLAQVNAAVQDVFSEQKDAIVRDARVVSYVDDVRFQLTRENNPAELLRYLEIVVKEGDRETSLTNMGTGTQSAVIIAMLELVLRSRVSGARVFAVEEPDAFIHPHGVRHLASLIRRIGDESAAQVVVTTHSPSLLATLAPRDIVRVEKKDGRTLAIQAPDRLADPAFARFVNRDTAEMFFARRVLLVEGATERFLLPPLSSMIVEGGRSLDFDERQLSVIELAGKGSVLSFVKILDSFGIEARAILDDDFLGDRICEKLVKYLQDTKRPIDATSAVTIRKDLLHHGVVVLSKGEIEDYVPATDVAAVSGRSLSEVQAAINAAGKTSDAFKKLFGDAKPVYARRLADHYTSQGAVPSDLERLVKHVSA